MYLIAVSLEEGRLNALALGFCILLGFGYAPLRYLAVVLVKLAPDEVHALLHAGDTGGAAAHEWVEDCPPPACIRGARTSA